MVLAANITGKALTVSSGLTANSKVYDGTTVATISSNNVVLAGVVGADVVSLSTNGYAASFASAGVSNGIAVSVSGLSLTWSERDQLHADAAGGAGGEHHGQGADGQFGADGEQQGV